MLFGVIILMPKDAAASVLPLNQVILSEILTGTSTSASQEFIEIYNNTDKDIDLTGWHIQYTSATKTDWASPSRNISLTGIIKTKAYYLLTSTAYLTSKANLSYSATLSQTGGHLRIVDKLSNTQDQLGWGNAAMPLGIAVEAPAAGSSLARLTNASGYNLTQDNSTDYAATLSPTPLGDNLITLPPSEDTGSDSSATSPAIGGTGSTPPVKIDYPVIQISELLPNPVSPQTDSNDEFIELYNPNDFDVVLAGYTITTGLNSTYKYAIKALTIAAGGYQIFTSGSTNLSLSNTAGKAQLLAPDGSLVDQTEPYVSAPAGQSWIVSNGVWQWTTNPTPNSDNILSVPVVKAASAKKAATKIFNPKVSKVKAAKKIKPKTVKANKPLATASPPTQTKLHPVVLAGVGSSALIYAMYEYRTDLAGNIYKLRRNREAWTAVWGSNFVTGFAGAKSRLGRWQDYLRAWLSQRPR